MANIVVFNTFSKVPTILFFYFDERLMLKSFYIANGFRLFNRWWWLKRFIQGISIVQNKVKS